jgi:hypothetical protein
MKKGHHRRAATRLKLEFTMSYEGLDGLVEEIRLASNSIAQADATNARQLNSIKDSINELSGRSVAPARRLGPTTQSRQPMAEVPWCADVI